MTKARFPTLLLMAGVFSGIALFSSPSLPAPPTSSRSWTSLAREVGQSEENRAHAIRALQKLPTLSADLREALKSPFDRPLALEVIGALQLRNLIPDLVLLVPNDPDGFTTLAVNALMTAESTPSILKTYSHLLDDAPKAHLSTPVIVAMLEPMARTNLKLSRGTLLNLAASPSPDVRSALLLYLRVMALKNESLDNLDLVTDMTNASEVQVRLQAISVSAEILARRRTLKLGSLRSFEDLNSLCLRELGSTLKEACLGLLAQPVAAKE